MFIYKGTTTGTAISITIYSIISALPGRLAHDSTEEDLQRFDHNLEDGVLVLALGLQPRET
jgi:hypothetical protein